MTTLIRTHCPIDGDISVAAPSVTVVTIPGRVGFYELRCPICHDRIRREAPPEIVALLATGGVRPHLTDADVLDAVVWLEEHDPSEEMA